MITTLMKCKLCGKIISPPDETPLIGQPPQLRNQKIIQKLMKHMQSHVETEAKLGAGPHLQAMADSSVAAQNFSGALLIGRFEISPEMEQDRQYVIFRIHDMTRSVRMTDEGLRDFAYDPQWQYQGDVDHQLLLMLRDLRDRYEGLGKYAPVSASNPAQTEPADSATPAASDKAHTV